MFQRLRLKLTIINSLIIVTLFLILAAGAYYFSHFNMKQRTSFIAQRMLTDIQNGVLQDLPIPRPPLPSAAPPPPAPSLFPPLLPSGPPGLPPRHAFFFVKTASAGQITFHSSTLSISEETLSLLTTKALRSKEEQGTLTVEQTDYFYRRESNRDAAGEIVIFLDLSIEQAMLRGQLTGLTIVGVICALLSFAASFFLANRAMFPIKTAWRQQKDFLSDASHELRTPLATIQANLDIIQSSPEETVASQQKWLDNIQAVSAGMAKLVDSLLFLARTDAGQPAFHKEVFSLTAILHQAVAQFEPSARLKGVSLETLAMPNPIKGYGDPDRVRQLIAILLDNAIRHTPSGGKVTSYLSQSDTKTLLTIADTGEGIAKENLDKIFNRFYQVSDARNPGSTGLGLAIAKSIVEGHGGSITADSSPGNGTAFMLEFPWGSGCR